MITVLAPAYYPSESKVKYLTKTAEYYGIPLKLYGVEQPYKGWINVQIDELINQLEELETSHFIYTDASDAFFLSDLDEIINKYKGYGRPPILFSLEQDGINAGGWMGEVIAGIEALRILQGEDFSKISNPQIRWRMAVSKCRIKIATDDFSSIFQVSGPELKVIGKRLYNPITCRMPSIVHFAGGYTDPETGKAELIEPVWNKLGYNLL